MMEVFPQYKTYQVLMAAPATAVAILSSLIVCALFVARRLTGYTRKDGCKIPPGPKGWPVVGTHDMW